MESSSVVHQTVFPLFLSRPTESWSLQAHSVGKERTSGKRWTTHGAEGAELPAVSSFLRPTEIPDVSKTILMTGKRHIKENERRVVVSTVYISHCLTWNSVDKASSPALKRAQPEVLCA